MFKRWPNFVDRDFALGFFDGNIGLFKEFHMQYLEEKSLMVPEEERDNIYEMASR
jgi:hypothetical protein